MMTVHEVSRRTGVSIRALHHYDSIGLLPATAVTDSGYRLYDDSALERLQMILLFKELEFPLKEIASILDHPEFDPRKALEQQIHLLELRRDHLSDLIDLAKNLQKTGVHMMNFDAFNTKKIDAYKEEARKTWGRTEAYKEYEKRSAGRTEDTQKSLNVQMMSIFARFGEIRTTPAGSEAAQALVKELQDHITANYYTCTDPILASLGMMYEAGGEFTENIDSVGGEGTAAYAAAAIRIHCGEQG